jgi:hypothetical protein
MVLAHNEHKDHVLRLWLRATSHQNLLYYQNIFCVALLPAKIMKILAQGHINILKSFEQLIGS